MPTYLKQAPIGFPGDITRSDNWETNVEPIMLIGVGSSPPVYPSAFGVPLKYVTGGAQQFNGGAETAASFAGILIREVPGISGGTTINIADTSWSGGAPNPLHPNGMAVRGYIAVTCTAGTPVRGGVVYIRIVAGTGNRVVGAFEAAADGANSVALTTDQASWASDGLDANGTAEIRLRR